MADGDDKDKDQATEDPTQRKIDDAYKKGQIIYSKDLCNVLMFIILIMAIQIIVPNLFLYKLNSLTSFVNYADQLDFTNMDNLKKVLFRSVYIFAIITSPILGLLWLIGLINPSMQNLRIIFSAEAFKMDLSRLSIIQGLGRVFSKKTLVEFIKNLVKISVIGVIGYWIITALGHKLVNIIDMDMGVIVLFIKKNITLLMFKLTLVLIAVAIFDYFYQRMKFFDDLKMTKQELKEEFKDTDGNPQIKSKLKSLRAEKARQRMMSNVPSADVVITNPTHFAVALKYKMETMAAPVVVAKGVDKVAFKIRDLAKKNDVPVVENPFLARELHKLVKLDEEIPLDYYQAVAEIISYVYKLKNKT
jgi:flagellar biosynthetic protein FlhB